MPAATMALAMPSPMPLAPPVTNATLSFSVSMGPHQEKRRARCRARLQVHTMRVLVEVALELDVPLARRTRLAFQGQLTEGRQVELVEVVLVVGQVGRAQGHPPVVLGAGQLDACVQKFVRRRTG